jgi:hypothetical protein
VSASRSHELRRLNHNKGHNRRPNPALRKNRKGVANPRNRNTD